MPKQLRQKKPNITDLNDPYFLFKEKNLLRNIVSVSLQALVEPTY